MKKRLSILIVLICIGAGILLFATMKLTSESNISGSYCLTIDDIFAQLELYPNNECSIIVKDDHFYVAKTGTYTFDGEIIIITWTTESEKEYVRYVRGIHSQNIGEYTSKPSVTMFGYKLEKDAC